MVPASIPVPVEEYSYPLGAACAGIVALGNHILHIVESSFDYSKTPMCKMVHHILDRPSFTPSSDYAEALV